MNISSRFFLLLIFLWGSFALAEEPFTFRVMTYNIHHAEGLDGRVDVERIAKVILDASADLVALQEVDKGVERTQRIDIPARLAELTGMQALFEKNIDYQGGEYGNAILSRFPVIESGNYHFKMIREGEQRGLLHARVMVAGHELVFLCTHIDYRRDDTERVSNVEEMRQIIQKHNPLPVILCGDFNDFPNSRVHRLVSNFLTDVWLQTGTGDGFTYSSAEPKSRIDYLWISSPKNTIPFQAHVIESKSSDHLPLVSVFQMKEPKSNH